MSGLSAAVLGSSVHASQRSTYSAAAPAAPTRSPSPAPVRTSAAQPKPSHRPAVSTVAVNGSAIDTRYGPVQVQITVRGGHVIASDAVAYPQDNGQSRAINTQAVPMLDGEAVRTDTARIDTVSGATYTSEGYRQSLQSALDAAHQAGIR